MGISAVLQSLGCDRFEELMSGISMGEFRTFQVCVSLKVCTGFNKVNHAKLKKALPRLWNRREDGDNNLAGEEPQAILVSNLEFVVTVFDFLQINHNSNEFSEKIDKKSATLRKGWQRRAYNEIERWVFGSINTALFESSRIRN